MEMLTGALQLASEYGFRVHPLVPQQKRPLLTGWPELATTDEATITEWWTTWPNANVGIATGAASGIVVLDVDPKNGGAESLERLKQDATDWPDTMTVLTGSGGLHFYFAYQAGLRNLNSELGPGLDIKTDRGQVVAPPSIHPNGNRYEWLTQ